MFLLASFAFIGGIVVGGSAIYCSTTSRYLADPFIDRLTKKKVSQPPKINMDLLGDPDIGLELQDAIKTRLQRSLASVQSGQKTTPAQDVAAKLGLEW